MASDSAVNRQRLRNALLAWTAIIVVVTWGALDVRLRNYRDQVQATAAARTTAVLDTLAIAFRQWAALPANLARRGAVRQFMADREAELGAADPAAWRDDQPRYIERAEVRAMDEEISALGEDFVLSFAALVGTRGQVLSVTNRSGNRVASGRLDLSGRGYVRDALTHGLGSQFVLGRVSGVPGMYFASRVEHDGRILGVAAVKQDAEVINRMIAGRSTLIAVVDPNGVIVLGNRPEWLLRRLESAPAPSDAVAADLYQRQPETVPWPLQPAADAADTYVGDIDGLRHVAQRSAVPGTPLTLWVLAPLGDAAAIRARFLLGLGALWLIGTGVVWYAWRRLHWLQESVAAQRRVAALDDRFAAVWEHAASAHLFFTARNGIDQCNPAALRLFGAASETDLIGRILWHPPLSAELQADGRPSNARRAPA